MDSLAPFGRLYSSIFKKH